MNKARRTVLIVFLVLLLTGGSFWVWNWRGPGNFFGFPALPEDTPGEIAGRVLDYSGPVAGARVRFQGHPTFVLTDARGQFRLPAVADGATPVTAAKEGYFIAGATAAVKPVVLTLNRLPTEDCADYAWVAPDADPAGQHNCATCHARNYREWAASAHSRSATGKHFRNLYEGSDWHGRPGVGWNLLAEHPDGAGVCTACHAPTVPFNDPAYYDLRKVSGVPARGVHCDGCHKISKVTTEQFGLTQGRFGFEVLRPLEGQLFFGALDDVDRGEEAYSPLYKESRYCASCHEGTIFGVPVYTTYSEWLASTARQEGKDCQTCHMAPTELTRAQRLRVVATGGPPRDPQTLSNHRFFAGSQEEMLRDCLKLTTQVTVQPEQVRVEVEVRADNVGHRVPTGFVDRNLVLVVLGFDREMKALAAHAGPTLSPLAGNEQGQAGKLFAKVLSDFDGNSPVPFWRARPEVADTRLRPGQPEQAVFVFPPPTERVRIQVLYRRFWPDVARTKDWPDKDLAVVDRWLEVRPSP